MSLGALFNSMRYNFKRSGAILISCRQCSTQTTAEEHHTNGKYEDDIRNKILEASLKFVNNMGWSKDALAAGAEEIGYPGITHGIFTRGGADLLNYFQQTSNQKLVEYMKTQIEKIEEQKLVPAEFVEDSVKQRLEMIVPYLSRWPQAIAIMALPPNVPSALATQLTMVDDICYYAGDRSVDFSWYARRLALAAIYKATELYMIQDRSSDHLETWRFLNNRLSEAIQIQNLLLPTGKSNERGADALSSAFITARNILSMNNR